MAHTCRLCRATYPDYETLHAHYAQDHPHAHYRLHRWIESVSTPLPEYEQDDDHTHHDALVTDYIAQHTRRTAQLPPAA